MFARLVLIGVVLLVACDKPTHDNFDKWMHTEQGPGKLRKALQNDSLDPDLAAHAAANMVRMNRDADVVADLRAMSADRVQAVVSKLAPRLWQLARVEGELQLPAPQQVTPKDALFAIRKFADAPTRQLIDGYMVDWYAVPSYDDAKGGGRAVMGGTTGPAVLRAVGAQAAKKMIEIANGVVAAPGQEKVKLRVGDELLLGLAATCSPDTVKYVLDVAKLPRGDETLPQRAMDALFKAYVDPQGMFDACDREALTPSVDALVRIARDDHVPPAAADDALSLVRALGAPACVAPLVDLIAQPHANPKFKFSTAQAALRCGGIAAIKPVAEAMPQGPYARDELDGAVAGEIARLKPRDPVLAAVRSLLDDKSAIARWIGVEALGDLKSTEDAGRLTHVKDHTVLAGYWGDNGDRKPVPTLDQRAKEVADRLSPAGTGARPPPPPNPIGAPGAQGGAAVSKPAK
jgi:hypothetical protein